jgi:hypothetical protein
MNVVDYLHNQIQYRMAGHRAKSGLMLGLSLMLDLSLSVGGAFFIRLRHIDNSLFIT